MASQTIEIARQEGKNFRSVRLTLGEDGAIKMDTQDMGAATAEFWGEDEYEFWVRIPPAAVPKLVFELLREKFAGQAGAVDALREWCKAHGIEHEFDSWV
jgi:hypothetical protein